MMFPSLRPSRPRIVSAVLVIFSSLSGVRALAIDTPPAVAQCESAKLTWHGDHSPFTLHILFSQNNSLVQEFANVSANSVVWQAAAPAGTMLYLEVFDSDTADDSPSYSGNFPILPGDNSCLQVSSNSSSTDTPATTPSYTSTGGSSLQPSGGRAANSPERKPANTLSTSAIAGIAIACLAAGVLITLGVWLTRRRRNSSSLPRIVSAQRQFYIYNDPKSPRVDDGWHSNPDHDERRLRSQLPARDDADPSGDPGLIVREEKAPSSSPPTDQPVVTRQGATAVPLVPLPDPIPGLPARVPEPRNAGPPSPRVLSDTETDTGAAVARLPTSSSSSSSYSTPPPSYHTRRSAGSVHTTPSPTPDSPPFPPPAYVPASLFGTRAPSGARSGSSEVDVAFGRRLGATIQEPPMDGTDGTSRSENGGIDSPDDDDDDSDLGGDVNPFADSSEDAPGEDGCADATGVAIR